MAIAEEGMVASYQSTTGAGNSDSEVGGMIPPGRSPMPDLISFIIPTYNEGRNLYSNLLECHQVVSELKIPFEMVVVNDGSEDNSWSEILRFANAHPEVVPVTYSHNFGKGHALRVGTRRARGNLVVFLDADMEIHPSQIGRFIEEMKESHADVVIGSKRHPESKVDYPTKRKFLSWGYHLVIRAMFDLDLTDTQPGFKLFKKEVLDKEINKVVAEAYAFDLDLLANASMDGYKIVEAPIELKFSRKFGGRIGFKTVRSIFIETLGIYYRLRVEKRQNKRNALSSQPANDR